MAELVFLWRFSGLAHAHSHPTLNQHSQKQWSQVPCTETVSQINLSSLKLLSGILWQEHKALTSTTTCNLLCASCEKYTLLTLNSLLYPLLHKSPPWCPPCSVGLLLSVLVWLGFCYSRSGTADGVYIPSKLIMVEEIMSWKCINMSNSYTQ